MNGSVPESKQFVFDEETADLNVIEGFYDLYKNNLQAFKAFTLTPNPAKYPTFEPDGQWRSLLQSLFHKNILKSSLSVFLFVPELNESGNVHIHGVYSVKDEIKYYKKFLPKMKRLGFICVKKKVDIGWFKYLGKDIEKYQFNDKVLEKLYNEALIDEEQDRSLPRILHSDNYDYWKYVLVVEPKYRMLLRGVPRGVKYKYDFKKGTNKK